MLRISSNLVSVPVSVINRQGQYVVDLQRQDFRVFEDGKEQTIVHFSNVDQPFSVVLLIDTSGSTTPFLEQIKSAAKAFVEQLRPTEAYQFGYVEAGIPAYLRGSAYLQMKQGPQAAAEFQKILDHQAALGFTAYLSLAKLGLARAYAASGDSAKARTAYQDFFTLWKDADGEIPILKSAKAEYAKLQ